MIPDETRHVNFEIQSVNRPGNTINAEQLARLLTKCIEYRLEPRSCVDCKTETLDQYMLKDELWKSAGLGRWDLCCIPCLMKRIGRRVKKSDLQFTPMVNRLALLIEEG